MAVSRSVKICRVDSHGSFPCGVNSLSRGRVVRSSCHAEPKSRASERYDGKCYPENRTGDWSMTEIVRIRTIRERLLTGDARQPALIPAQVRNGRLLPLLPFFLRKGCRPAHRAGGVARYASGRNSQHIPEAVRHPWRGSLRWECFESWWSMVRQ